MHHLIVYLKWASLLLITAYIMTPSAVPSFENLLIGEKIWQDIRSNHEFTVIDDSATEKRRLTAENAVLPVYDFDSSLGGKLNQKLTKVFGDWRQRLREDRLRSELNPTGSPSNTLDYLDMDATESNAPIPASDDSTRHALFLEETGLKISPETFQMLRSMNFSVEIEKSTQEILERLCNYAIVTNRSLLLEQAINGLTRRDLTTNEEKNIYNLELIVSIEEINREIDIHTSRTHPDNQILQDIIADLSRNLIRPNLTLNMQETVARRRQAAELIKPVFYKVSAGEIIARSGDRITPEIKIRLDQLNRVGQKNRFGVVFFGNLAFLAILFAVAALYLNRFEKELLNDSNRVTLIGLISLLHVLLIKLFVFIFAFIPDFTSRYPFDSSEPYQYAIPFSAGALLFALLVNERLAMVFSFIFGVLAAIGTDQNFFLGMYAMVSGCTTVFTISKYKQRTMVVQAGLLVSLVNLVLVVTLYSIKGELASLTAALAVFMAIIGGVLVAILVTLLLPLLEWIFQIPTDIRLLELSNFNQPLLRQLAMDAPGTHHHSLMVGDLSETAAEAIGANALLAKVGAYYHDIGKISKPEYFIENTSGKNPHDMLTPSMSVMVIRNHVKEGVELARKSGLGSDILAIIEQHHGSSLMTFFYEKAKEQAKVENREFFADEFRYPGPRPRSKEAAIVLIADAVEAAARSLKNPSASNIKELVNRITVSKFKDHQFDNCNLTFNELTIIADRLFHRLIQIYHNRIQYPGFNFEGKSKLDDSIIPMDDVNSTSEKQEEV